MPLSSSASSLDKNAYGAFALLKSAKPSDRSLIQTSRLDSSQYRLQSGSWAIARTDLSFDSAHCSIAIKVMASGNSFFFFPDSENGALLEKYCLSKLEISR